MAVYANRGAFGTGPKSTSTYQRARNEALREAAARRAWDRSKERIEETMENIITIDGERVVDLVEVSPGLWMTPEDARARS